MLSCTVCVCVVGFWVFKMYSRHRDSRPSNDDHDSLADLTPTSVSAHGAKAVVSSGEQQLNSSSNTDVVTIKID